MKVRKEARKNKDRNTEKEEIGRKERHTIKKGRK